MNIPCAKCGAKNELGRVFCASCGQKLDLSQRTAAHDIEQDFGPNILKRVAVFVVAGIVLALLAFGALALWPAKPIVDNVGEKRGAVRVAQLLLEAKKALAVSPAGERRSLQFTEKELNSCLERKCEGLGLNSVTVNLFPGGFVLRIEQPGIGLPFTLPGMTSSQLPITYIVRGGFVNVPPARLVIRGVRMGHLPLTGGMRSSVYKKLNEIFADFTKEQGLVTALQEVAIDDDKADLIFQK